MYFRNLLWGVFSLLEKIIYGEVIYGEVTAEGFKQVINVENERNVCPKVSTLGGQSSSCTRGNSTATAPPTGASRYRRPADLTPNQRFCFF